MPLDYSIIVPAYNEAQELPATLAAIRVAMNCSSLSGECIVVDNNSSDDTAQVAQASGADLVVYEPINQIARARNTGGRSSNGRYLIFIDADTRISANLFLEALRQLKDKNCVGGGAVIQFEGEVSHIGRFCIGVWEFVSKLSSIAAGSFLFCTREAFEAVGGYDETLYASEEVRFSYQLKRWGKARDLGFVILDHAPAQTSARKLQWYSGPQMIGWISLMLLMPITVRSKRLCKFWYHRPQTQS